MPQMILSSVLLPQPLRPMMPSVSPASQFEAHVVEHAELLEPPPIEQAEHVLAHGVAPHAGDAERLRHAADLDEWQPSEVLRGARRVAAEQEEPGPQDDRGSRARARRARVRPGVSPSTSTARENWMNGVGGHR